MRFVPRLSRRRVGAGLFALAAVLVIAAGVVFLVGGREASPVSAGNTFNVPPSSVVGSPTPTVPPTTTDTPGPPPTPAPSSSPISRIIIPAARVNAPIEVKGLDRYHAMQDPSTPKIVAWYDFSSLPGHGGNVVMAGHVDYVHYGPAVFWYLTELKPGDVIELKQADGSLYYYKVFYNELVNARETNFNTIVGPTPQEQVTLITCGGAYDYTRHEYIQRRIVKAVLATPPAPDSQTTYPAG